MSTLSFTIKLVDKISDTLKKIQGDVSDISKKMDKATGATSKFEQIFKKIQAPNVGAWLDISDRIGSAFSSAASTGMAFGQSMADLSSITGITGAELANLEENARKIGASSGLGADTAARAYATLASQIEISRIGIDGLNTLQEKSVTLAQAAGMSLDGAAVALSATINQFGLGADEADRVINVLAAGSKFGAAEITDLAQSFKVTGSAASAMGLSVEETAGALEILSQANLKGSEAGTALRNIILKLNTELGIDLSQTSLGTALDSLKPKLTDAAYLSKVFGMENIAAAQFLIQNAAAVDEMTAKVTGTSVAQEQAAIRTDTTAQRMAELRAKIDGVKITLTDITGSFAPYIAILTENAAAITMAVQVTKSMITSFTAVKTVLSAVHIKTVAHTAALITHRAATLAVAAAAKVWTGIQAALNAVLSANPVAMLVLGIGALVAAVIAAYKNFDGFRQICDTVWSAVKNVASAVWDGLVKAFEAVSGAIKKAWTWLKNFLGMESDTSAIDAATEAVEAQTEAIEKNNAERGKKPGEITYTGNVNVPAVSMPAVPEIPEYDPDAPLDNIAAINAALDHWRDKQQTASRETIGGINDTIASLIELRSEYESISNAPQASEAAETPVEAETPAFDPSAPLESIRQITAAIEHYRTLRLDATAESISGIDAEIARLEQLRDSFGKVAESELTAADHARGAVGAITNVASIMQSLSGVVGKSAGSWLQWGGNVLSAVSQALPMIAQLIGGNIAQAFSGAIAQSQSVPFPYNLISLAASLASVGAAVASIPKFAAGGIAYGPTVGLFGEYAGARSNPEVVAPLNRLRDMIAPATQTEAVGGHVEFVIDGRVLRGVLAKTEHTTLRTR